MTLKKTVKPVISTDCEDIGLDAIGLLDLRVTRIALQKVKAELVLRKLEYRFLLPVVETMLAIPGRAYIWSINRFFHIGKSVGDDGTKLKFILIYLKLFTLLQPFFKVGVFFLERKNRLLSIQHRLLHRNDALVRHQNFLRYGVPAAQQPECFDNSLESAGGGFESSNCIHDQGVSGNDQSSIEQAYRQIDELVEELKHLNRLIEDWQKLI